MTSEVQPTGDSEVPSVSSPLRCSVIIPSAGPAQALAATLRALADQSVAGESIEVIVVDNNCDAAASQRLRSVAEPFGVTMVPEPTPGPAAARNRGVAAARGRVVIFVDDDIEVPHDFVEAHLAVHTGSDPVVGVGRIVESNSHSKWFLRYLVERRVVNRPPDPDRPDFRAFYGANASVSRSVIAAVGGYDEGFSRREDAELGYRLMVAGASYRYVDRAVVHHHSAFGPVTHVKRSYSNGYFLAMLLEKHPDIARYENLAMFSPVRTTLAALAAPALIGVGIIMYPLSPWALFKGMTALVLVQNNRGFAAYRRAHAGGVA